MVIGKGQTPVQFAVRWVGTFDGLCVIRLSLIPRRGSWSVLFGRISGGRGLCFAFTLAVTGALVLERRREL